MGKIKEQLLDFEPVIVKINQHIQHYIECQKRLDESNILEDAKIRTVYKAKIEALKKLRTELIFEIED